MLSKIPSERIFCGNYGWHTGSFHFSFGDYEAPDNTHFGDLIAFNDFLLDPDSGFATHSHDEIEIISYCVDGEMLHEDNMGNKNKLRRGDVQYTCAGSGITHSEFNNSIESYLRFIQIWIRPNIGKLSPNYSVVHFEQADRLNKFLQIASGQEINGVTRINQDTNIFVSEIETGEQVKMGECANRQAYMTCLEGTLDINGMLMKQGDAIKIWNETILKLTAVEHCHLIMVEAPQKNGERFAEESGSIATQSRENGFN
jgi:hypothetical protein